ncbi:ABC transporter ATP-binding protein [Dehalobacter restrictus]|jgi:molybdate transport system ATP-binding protein|uniref:sulfate/molybdate ABC transporter ATP-binding protein n=1 Tax=Dehalobacter restrictus TaxID=55583 RepID=UPI00338F6FEA
MLEVSIEKTLGNFTLQASFASGNGVLGILGSSGCGKSLTLKCVAGLYTPDEGTIRLNGKELFNSETKVNILPRHRNIGYVFQNYALFPHLTVYKNIAYGIQHLDKNNRHELVTEMIGKMQLSGHEKQYPSQLSGGQQQRVALARTLINEPELLLLDEPFSALDSHVKQILEKELLSIIKKNYHGIVLLVTHNIEEAYRLCDRILVVDKGKSIQIGDKGEIIRCPATVSAARITGCKNFFEVNVIGEEEGYLKAKSDSFCLRTTKRNSRFSKNMMAGIRAHDLRISPNKIGTANTFECQAIDKIEGIVSTTLIVDCQGKTLQVEIPNNDFHCLAHSREQKLWLYFPEDKIFLMDKEHKHRLI